MKCDILTALGVNMGIEYEIQKLEDDFWALQQLDWNKLTLKRLSELEKECKILIKRIKITGDDHNLLAEIFLDECKCKLNSLKQRIWNYRSRMQTFLDSRPSYRKTT